MATLTRDGDDLVITLTTAKRVEALGVNAELRIPISAIRDLDIIDDPIREIHGLRPRNFKITGTYFPGKTAVGTFLDGSLGTRLFAAAHGGQWRGLRIHLDAADFHDVILSQDDPEAAKHLISEA